MCWLQCRALHVIRWCHYQLFPIENHLIPKIVWFFHSVDGLKVKLSEVHSVEGKHLSLNVSINSFKVQNWRQRVCFVVIIQLQILIKKQCPGKNNVLTKSRNLWSRNEFVIGWGTYIIHNCIQTCLISYHLR